MLHFLISLVYLNRLLLVLYIYIYMPFILLVSCLMKFTCYVQVLQDTGVYGLSASQLLDLGVSEF